MLVPCDYCLERFSRFFISHRHDLNASFCSVCGKLFSPGTKRTILEKHIQTYCKENYLLMKIPISKDNRPTDYFIYIEGERLYVDYYSKSEIEIACPYIFPTPICLKIIPKFFKTISK